MTSRPWKRPPACMNRGCRYETQKVKSRVAQFGIRYDLISVLQLAEMTQHLHNTALEGASSRPIRSTFSFDRSAVQRHTTNGSRATTDLSGNSVSHLKYDL